MQLQKILKSTAAIVVPPTVRVLPTLLRSVATAAPATPKTSTAPQ
jgi:hypothetical protein